MNSQWNNTKNLLCIRPDNMGDVIMTTPAIHALKSSLNCKISLLTSPSGNAISQYIPDIDDTIMTSLPWVKTYQEPLSSPQLLKLIRYIKSRKFDGAIIFNVFSQNPWGSILLAYLSDIPLRLAYSKEKPYQLLTDWIPDYEPGKFILHEAERQLELVKRIGATSKNLKYRISYSKSALASVLRKLHNLGLKDSKKNIILHPGATSEKRQYSAVGFAKAAQLIYRKTGHNILFTGLKEERNLAYEIQARSQIPATNLAGILSLEEFIALIDIADLLISNNTGPVHIASALETPVVDLYALTNPQHTPWKVKSEVLYFEVPKNLAQNIVSTQIPDNAKPLKSPETILNAALKLLDNKTTNNYFSKRKIYATLSN